MIKNRQLIVHGVFLSDVAKALEEKGIMLNKFNVEAAAMHVQNIASAHAKAVLQDNTKEQWEWIIEVFLDMAKEHQNNNP